MKKIGLVHRSAVSYTPPKVYQIYGLRLRSDLRLPELSSSASAYDVILRYGTVDEPARAVGPIERGCYYATPSEAIFFYPTVGKIAVFNGREIVLDLLPGYQETILRHIVLGVVFGVLLHQRGYLTLHASAVNIGGEGVAFIGWKRMGKSTTAAAMHSAGHELICDDTVVLDRERSTHVLPGPRQLKLDPDAVSAALDLDPESIPKLQRGFRRRLHALEASSSSDPLPLRRIYILDWGPTLHIESVSRPAALIELLRHSYAQRFLGSVSGTPQHFRQTEEIVRRVPVFRLTKPAALERLSEVVHLIEDHALSSETA